MALHSVPRISPQTTQLRSVRQSRPGGTRPSIQRAKLFFTGFATETTSLPIPEHKSLPGNRDQHRRDDRYIQPHLSRGSSMSPHGQGKHQETRNALGHPLRW